MCEAGSPVQRDATGGDIQDTIFCAPVLDGTGFDNQAVRYDCFGSGSHNAARDSGTADSIEHVSGSYNRSTCSYNYSAGRNDHDVGRNNERAGSDDDYGSGCDNHRSGRYDACYDPDYRNPDTDDHSHQSSSSDHTGRIICRGNQMGE